MKTLTLALLAAASVTASASTLTAETFHVSAVRDWQPTDKHCPMKCYIVTGTVGDVKYTAQQLFTPFGSQHFQVGADYPVTVKGQSLNVKMTDKKGHEVPERLDVLGAEEAK